VKHGWNKTGDREGTEEEKEGDWYHPRANFSAVVALMFLGHTETVLWTWRASADVQGDCFR